MKIALIETKVSRTNFKREFDDEFIFDQYQLCSDPGIKKVLKRDVDIEIDVDYYDWIILVGSDALKHYTKATSVTEYSGKLINDKYLPVINPAMLAFKPEMKKTWDRSKENIKQYIAGTLEDVVVDDSVVRGIQDTDELNAWLEDALASPKSYVSLDSETSSLYARNGYVLGFSMSYDGEHGVYVDTACIDEKAERLMQQIFNKKTVIFHNAKFDLAFFKYHFEFAFPEYEDTMLLHYLIDETPGTHGLKQLAMLYTKYGDYEAPMHEWIAFYCKKHKVLKRDFTYDLIPFDIMYPYAAMDALVTFQIYEKFIKIKQNKKLRWVYENILIPGCSFLEEVQNNGVPFDRERLAASQVLMQKDIDTAVSSLYKHSVIGKFEESQGKRFNPQSTLQLRKLLFDFIGLKPTGIKTGTGADSTNAEVLMELSQKHEIPALILDIRQKSKIKNTYLDKIIPQLDRDNRLRTNFNLHTTTSGRLSSSGKLNMQQLPRDNPIIKGCITARPGYKIVAMDLTTAEVYAAAVLAGDEALMDIFRNGGDFHGAIAQKVFRLKCGVDEVKTLFPTERQAAKAVTFGIMYGAGAAKISEEVTKSSGTYFSKAEAQEVIDDYFANFHKLKDWLDNNKGFILSNGFIYSAFGRKRRLPNVTSTDQGTKAHCVRSGLNFLVQSVASDINLLGAIDMQAYIKVNNKDWNIFALVHDSILAEVPENEVEDYSSNLLHFVQMDRGVSIPNCPVGCDFDVGDDYSFGKYEKMYEQGAA